MRKFVKEFLHTISYCRPYKRLYYWGLFSLILVDIADVAAPLLIKIGVAGVSQRYLDDGSINPDYEPSFLENLLPAEAFSPDAWYHGAWIFGVAYLALVCFAGYFRFWMSFSFAKAMINVANDLRNRMFGHVQKLHAGHHDRSTVGSVMSLATNDIDACRFFWGFGLLLLVDVCLYVLLTPAMMLSISVPLTLACILPLVFLPFVIARIAKAIEVRFHDVQEQFSSLSDRASESFNGSKVVKSFAAEDQEVKRFSALSRDYMRKALRLAKVQTLEDPLLVFFIGVVQLVVFGYGGYLVLSGELGVDDFVAFFFFVLRLAFPMMELGFVIALYQRCVVSRRRIEALMSTPAEIDDAPNAKALATCRGELEFRDLTFAYFPGDDQESTPALRNISLKVPAGSSLGIVGEVGSGKSTLLGLIPRLYDPPKGTLFIDGVDVHDLPLDWLRAQVAVVPQETFLFSEPIIENISFGVDPEKADKERLKSFARTAQVEADILAFPRGYDTLLGEKGVNLSGGQKQRVAIARALACDPRILLLDDCLSAVDAHTEEAILRGLKGEMAGRTTLVVSHRVSTVMHCDQIVVLESGEVIERGSHSELLKQQGWYADLASKQQLEAQIDQMSS